LSAQPPDKEVLVSEAFDRLIPQPTAPARLPFGVPPETALAWRERLDDLPDDEARIRAVREELAAARALAKYIGGWRAYFWARWYIAGATVRAISRAAGVADTYISRMFRELGLEPRVVRARK
jgi:hypothetical protein